MSLYMIFSKFLNKNFIVIFFIIIIICSCFSYEEMKVSNYKGKKVKFYNFNTRWCYYSKILVPEWNKLTKYYKNNKSVQIIDIKCDDKKNKKICNQFGIKKYPTLIKVKGGKQVQYNGERKLKNFVDFIEK